MMTDKDTPQPDFEAAMDELEKLVARMEEGDLPLEETLKQFERGIALTRKCQKALVEAEQKVEILVEKAGQTQLEAFDPDQ
jgi:exodeoxyribonuclease VII small subunit